MPESVSFAEAVNTGIDAALEHVHTTTIGIVDSYNGTKQRAKIASALRHPLLTADGEPVYEDFPVWDDVPVVWPRAGAGGLHGPLAAGHFVLLAFLQTSPAEWRASAYGTAQDSADLRRHSEGYPVALAGLGVDSSPLSSVTSNAWELGYFGISKGRIIVKQNEILLGRTAVEYVALASLVDARITALQEAFDALVTNFNAHQHAYTTTAGFTTGTQTGAAVGALGNTAATIVKAL